MATTESRATAESTAVAAQQGVDAAKPERRPWQQGPLPEIAGYVGASLVASAALNFVAQSWEDWSTVVRLSIVGTAVVLLYAAGLIILALAGGRAGLARDDRANRRRLVAVLFAFAAPLAGAFVAVILDAQGLFAQVTPWLILPGVVALAAAIAGAWPTPGVVSTLVVGGTAAWMALASTIVVAENQPEWWVPVIAAAFGALWLAIAPRLLAIPTLSEALGVAWILLMLGPAAVTDLAATPEVTDAQAAAVWVSRALLLGFTAIALTLFARGASGAWAVGGVLAAVMASMGIAGQALGWVAALLVAGVVLLALSGLLLVLRRRTAEPEAPTSDPVP